MPVYDTAGAIRPQDAVGDFYQGKALRAQIAAQEKATDLMDEETAIRQQNADTASGNLQMRVEEYARGVSSDLREMQAEQRERLISGARSASAWFDANPDDVEGATAQFAIGSGLDPEEIRGQFGTIEPHEAYGLVAAEDYEMAGEPTADEQFINNLNVSDEEKDRLKLAIARKKGTITGTTPEDLERSGLSDSGLNKITVDFREKARQASVAASTATEMVQVANRSPAALAKSGAIITFGNELYSTAKNLIEVVGDAELPDEQTRLQSQGADAFGWDALEKAVSKLDILPEDAARMKSGIYSLAFSAAVGEQGSRPSDKDIQAYITIYGGQITDSRAFKGTISQAMRRQRNSLYFMAEMNPEIQNPEVQMRVFDREYAKFLDAVDSGSSGGAPKGYTGPTANAKDGSLLILSEDGTKWVKAP